MLHHQVAAETSPGARAQLAVGEGLRSGHGPVAEFLVGAAASSTARIHRVLSPFRALRKGPLPGRELLRARGSLNDAHTCTPRAPRQSVVGGCSFARLAWLLRGHALAATACPCCGGGRFPAHRPACSAAKDPSRSRGRPLGAGSWRKGWSAGAIAWRRCPPRTPRRARRARLGRSRRPCIGASSCPAAQRRPPPTFVTPGYG